ncbi:MAG TPA: phosphodiester glycosidase family protein [Candidatus Baltobacteraceae bacterium]|nr:phosphodiester glycosidase family protein [Candidatus Baltobacteraceae bacterium]
MAIAALLLGTLLPMAPQPRPPFPKIVTDAPTVQDVAPGVQYAQYDMLTQDGPLAVHVIAVDLHEPTIRIGTALAQDRLISSGETVSSMAQRTNAVAGINGDYFDINQTNQPLNILISNGRLIRAPMQRWAIDFTASKHVSFDEFHIGATATLPTGSIAVKTINDWPPPGGDAVLITPEFGPLRPEENVTEIPLAPQNGTPPFATYRALSIADNTVAQPAGYYLAIGQNEYGQADPPQAGDPVTIAADATPPLQDITAAIGGGPLLVKDGEWYADPDGPSTGEFATHMPASGVALTRDGTLLLFEIDGRQPETSIGVLQPQFAALMIAFGAQTGMQFDGGGSSTLVARVPGERTAQVLNAPSDGKERRIADALLVYSDAPEGPPARLYATPQEVRAFPGAHVALHVAVTDEGGHPRCACGVRMQVIPGNAGAVDGGVFIAGNRETQASIRVVSGTLQTTVPVHISSAVSRIQILPLLPVVPENGELQLTARAYTAQGFPIALPDTLVWSARGGSIDGHGRFAARTANGVVGLRLGDRTASQTVIVGEHLFNVAFAPNAVFATAPRDQAGSIQKDRPCAGCLTLAYDFSGTERAAYADAAITLPEPALGLAADVYGDGNGEILRVAVNNAINERFLYTLSTIDWHGWKTVELRFPPALAQPLTLKSIYVINRVGPSQAVTASGSVALRSIRAILAGSAVESPK